MIKVDFRSTILLERIYNPITAMVFSAMFTFSWTILRGKNCRHHIAVIRVVDTFGLSQFQLNQQFDYISSILEIWVKIEYVNTYTVNNYMQVTGIATGENFAFFIYRHFVEIL